MAITHCLPSGSLGASEIPVMPINDHTVTIQAPGSGPYRGVIVVMHGLNQSGLTFPLPALTDIVGFLSGSWGTLVTTLNADGWVVAQVPENGDNYSGTYPSFGIASDINTDTGTRYRLNIVHWWQHIVDYFQKRYGANWPIIPFGGSWGGLHALIVAQDAPTPPPAVVVGVPATVVSNLSSNLWHGTSISSSAGVSPSTTCLNSFAGPSLVMYGTADGVVGWGLDGQGTCSTSPVQSNTDLIIVNAIAAGKSCTRLASHYTGHGFDTTDAASIQSWFNTIETGGLFPKNL